MLPFLKQRLAFVSYKRQNGFSPTNGVLRIVEVVFVPNPTGRFAILNLHLILCLSNTIGQVRLGPQAQVCLSLTQTAEKQPAKRRKTTSTIPNTPFIGGLQGSRYKHLATLRYPSHHDCKTFFSSFFFYQLSCLSISFKQS